MLKKCLEGNKVSGLLVICLRSVVGDRNLCVAENEEVETDSNDTDSDIDGDRNI